MRPIIASLIRMPLSPLDAVELFHLAFVRALMAKAEDKPLFAVKGGCNLRFFFGSVRCSEDLDLDVAVLATGTVKNKVDRLLASPPLTSPLRARGIAIEHATAPKHTETTQRWKIGLRVEGLSVSVRTKIELSRRDAMVGSAFEA